MVDPQLELNKLRWRLQDAAFASHEIDDICDAAFEAINSSILDTVAYATTEAVSYAESMDIQDFLSDIDVEQNGWSFRIVTRSGKTDYSIDKVENLPNLLKNAKVSEDGSRYKVIPIRDKPKVASSMFETMKNQEQTQREARAAIQKRASDKTTARANDIVDAVRSTLSHSLAAKKAETKGGDVHFRTATSKQDPHTQWVIPDISRDMTQYLFDLNDKLESNIDAAVYNVMMDYYREYT